MVLIHGASGKSTEMRGGEPHTTNNRMELTAAIRALEALKHRCRVHLFTDSQYLRKGITEWLPGWIVRGWKRKDGELQNELPLAPAGRADPRARHPLGLDPGARRQQVERARGPARHGGDPGAARRPEVEGEGSHGTSGRRGLPAGLGVGQAGRVGGVDPPRGERDGDLRGRDGDDLEPIAHHLGPQPRRKRSLAKRQGGGTAPVSVEQLRRKARTARPSTWWATGACTTWPMPMRPPPRPARQPPPPRRRLLPEHIDTAPPQHDPTPADGDGPTSVPKATPSPSAAQRHRPRDGRLPGPSPVPTSVRPRLLKRDAP